MTVLITGGAGFIGQHLAQLLTSRGVEVAAFDSLNPQVHINPEEAVDRFPGVVHRGDVSDAEAWAAVQEHGPFEAIIHLAAETGTGQSMYEQERYHQANVEGTRLAARAAKQWGVPLVSLSSRAVYGEGRHECAEHGTTFGAVCCGQASAADSRETDEHRPVSVYGETKSLAETAARDEIAGAVGLAIIRPQNVIGAGQALHNPYTGVLAAFLARLREGKPLSIYGDGSQTRDFVHVTDVARVIAWALDEVREGGEIVANAGTGERITLLDLARYAIDASPDGPVDIEHVEVHRAGDIQDANADMSHVQQLGGPLAKMTPAEAVADFIRTSWGLPGARSDAWDTALEELREKGLTS